MKPLLLAVFAAFTLVLSGCTKEQVKDKICDTGKTAAIVVAVKIADELSCKNIAAIQATLEEKLVEAKLCEKAEDSVAKSVGLIETKSVLGDAICAPVINGLLAGGLSQLPKEWECSGGPLVDETKAKLIEACTKAL